MSLEECIKRPLKVVQDIFAQHADGTPDSALGAITKHFERVLANPAALQQVPCLTAATADNIASGTLVRFRGMVQDMLNPEYYLGAYQLPDGSWRTTQFSDEPPADLEAARETRVWERRPLYCSRPGPAGGWAEARWTGVPPEPQTPGAAERLGKRGRDCSEDGGGAAGQQGAPRPARDQDAWGGARAAGKAPKTQAPGAAAEAGGAARDQGAPQAPGAASQPGDCIVYLHSESGEPLRLHDEVEVVGVLSVVPGLAAAQMRAAARRAAGAPRAEAAGGMDVDGDGEGEGAGAEEGGMEEGDAWGGDALEAGAHPPTSQALRLHAVLARRVPPREPPPRAPASLKPEELRASVPALRATALRALGAALGGDALAAEYVLTAALGCVHKRVDGVPHGHAHVNIVMPAGEGPSPAGPLLEALSALLPCVAALPVTLESVNAGGWAPRKDHASGRLLRGALQLPPGALLLLDETQMAAGAVGEAGVRSLQALGRVLAEQQLPVDFEFYQADYPLDVAAITVSRGRSLLRDMHHFVVPLAPPPAAAANPSDAPISDAPGSDTDVRFDASQLEAVRDYLSFARCLQCQLDEPAAERLAAAFGDAARAEPGFDMDRFNACVTLAKLLSLSVGQDRFDMSSWDHAMRLEAQRRQRLAAALPAQRAPAAPAAGGAAAAAAPAAP